jgi:hypothetical protein
MANDEDRIARKLRHEYESCSRAPLQCRKHLLSVLLWITLKDLDKYQHKNPVNVSAVRVEDSKALFTPANLFWRPSSTLPLFRQSRLQPFNQIHLKMYYTLLGVNQIFFKRRIYSRLSRLILNVHRIHWLVLEM